MDPNTQFEIEKDARIKSYGKKKKLCDAAGMFLDESIKNKYSYNFSWLGRPIIQYPQDMVAMQELIWLVKPDMIVETGIAHGGSLIFYASLLALIGKGTVLGIDVDIRDHNRKAIESHPLFSRISMIEGSSVSESTMEKVKEAALGKEVIMVCLDSNHEHDHVLCEMQLYSPLVTKGSYMVVFDTVVEDLPDDFYQDRPWKVGCNPKTAVKEFLKNNNRFEIDEFIEKKLLITVAPSGYLRCIR